MSLLSPSDPAHTVGLNSRMPPTPPHDPQQDLRFCGPHIDVLLITERCLAKDVQDRFSNKHYPLTHNYFTRTLQGESFCVIPDGFCTLKLTGKERHFEGIMCQTLTKVVFSCESDDLRAHMKDFHLPLHSRSVFSRIGVVPARKTFLHFPRTFGSVAETLWRPLGF